MASDALSLDASSSTLARSMTVASMVLDPGASATTLNSIVADAPGASGASPSESVQTKGLPAQPGMGSARESPSSRSTVTSGESAETVPSLATVTVAENGSPTATGESGPEIVTPTSVVVSAARRAAISSSVGRSSSSDGSTAPSAEYPDWWNDIEMFDQSSWSEWVCRSDPGALVARHDPGSSPGSAFRPAWGSAMSVSLSGQMSNGLVAGMAVKAQS